MEDGTSIHSPLIDELAVRLSTLPNHGEILPSAISMTDVARSMTKYFRAVSFVLPCDHDAVKDLGRLTNGSPLTPGTAPPDFLLHPFRPRCIRLAYG